MSTSTWTDHDNDELMMHAEDGSTVLAVRPAGVVNAYAVQLDHQQALELYHQLGDHLMASAATEADMPAGYEVGADDLDAWATADLPDATADGYDWPAVDTDEPTVLEDAQGAIYGDRQASYGNPRPNFTRQAIMWTGLLHHKLEDGEHLEPDDVARCMVATKLARDVHSAKRDNRVDMAGYAAVLDRLESGQ